MGLCSGKDSFVTPLPKSSDNGLALENSSQNANPVSVHPMPLEDVNLKEETTVAKVGPGSSKFSGSSLPKDQENENFAGPPIKRRKRHRRKQVQNQEPCLMRGVYFKNMKWQAAIKVDKKQIHLGTVGSQEEAARLYDRAAFMCGREPNFELSEEEKQELRKFNWDEFLTMTRRAITNKKYKRRVGSGAQQRTEHPLQNGEWDSKNSVDGSSASEEMEPESSTS